MKGSLPILPRLFGSRASSAVSSVFHEGFGDAIPALNQALISEYMQIFEDGRGYAYPRLPRGLFGSPRPTSRVHVESIHTLCCGEANANSLLHLLAQNASWFEGRIYMGAAGFLNLSYIAAMKCAGAILFDINPLQTMYWNRIIPALAEHARLDDFMDWMQTDQHVFARDAAAVIERNSTTYAKSALERRTDPVHALFRTPGRLDHWRDMTYYPEFFWARNPEHYAYLHDMAQARAIGALTIDVLDHPAWKALACHLAQQPDVRARHVGMLYVSNILPFLEGDTDWTRASKKGANPSKAIAAMSQVLDPSGAAIIDGHAGHDLRWPASQKGAEHLDIGPLRNVWGGPRPA